MAIVYISFVGINFIYKVILNKTSNSIKIEMRMSFYKSIQNIKFTEYQKYLSNDFFYRMFIDSNTVIEFYFKLVLNLPVHCIMFFMSLFLMFMWSIQLTLIVIVLVLIQWIITVIFVKPTNRLNKILKEKEQSVMGKINKDFQQMDLVRSLSMEIGKCEESKMVMTDLAKSDLQNTKINEIYNGIIYFINSLGSLFILLIGLYFVQQNKITLGTVMAFTMLITYFGSSLTGIVGVFTNYFKSKISYNRIIEFLNFEDANIYGGEENLDNKYSIKIRNVSFAYDEISVFSNFSASINEGEIVVLKGGNGVGKTTLCRLLTRYIYPSSGQIYVGKHDISEIDISVYRKNIIFIGEATILQNSFRKNIDFYDKYSDAEIMSVLEQCNLTSLLEKKGWSLKDVNYINEKELSLGEKQKIAIARALICRPKILVLDEPTANLDDYTTNQIISNLVKYNSDEKCTIIVAAHDQRIDNYITKKIYL
jgi:ABC-type bacteriocin/lantibiotic exporter with double-glycine peptidase domain